MKLCPQCDFIYEDDQTVCDMDGKELVYEPTLGGSPTITALEPVVGLRRLRSGWPPQSRRFAFASAAGVVLAATLFFGYNLFTGHPDRPIESSSPAAASPSASTLTASANSTHSITVESATVSALADPVASKATALEPTDFGNAESAPAGPSDNAPKELRQHGDSSARLPELANRSRATDNQVAIPRNSSSLSISSLPRVKALPRLKPLPRLTPPNTTKRTGSITLSSRPTSGNQKQASANQRRDSRVSSFFKKTARILSKPFKR